MCARILRKVKDRGKSAIIRVTHPERVIAPVVEKLPDIGSLIKLMTKECSNELQGKRKRFEKKDPVQVVAFKPASTSTSILSKQRKSDEPLTLGDKRSPAKS